MDLIWNVLNSVGVVGTGIVAFVALRRNPRVMWVVEADVLMEETDLERGAPYYWGVVLVNRGRATATAVRTRYIDEHGIETAWHEREPVKQGDRLSLHAGMDARRIALIKSTRRPRKENGRLVGPLYEVEWRGHVERVKPRRDQYFPNATRTKIAGPLNLYRANPRLEH